MTATTEPTQHTCARFEWERIVRRIVMPWDLKGFAFMLSTWADQDGSRVRPGPALCAAVTGLSERTVRRWLKALHETYGLLMLVRRGGGRGKTGRVSEYRLALPVDLLERVDLIEPGEAGRQTPDTEVTEVSVDTPAVQVAEVSPPPPVDNSETPATEVAGVSGPAPGNSGQITPLPEQTPAKSAETPATQGVHLPTTRPTTTDQPGSHLPAQPLTARERRQARRPTPIPRTNRCPHGLSAARSPDGRPACALCRRAESTAEVESP